MSKSRRKITRRTMLRGLAGGAIASLALPPLEIMFNSSLTAHADGTALPKRFGLFFWGNGYSYWDPDTGVPDTWTPVGTGTSWTLSEQLAAFGEIPGRTPGSLQNRINVITGLGPKTGIPAGPSDQPYQGDPHMRGIANALTADRPREEDFCHSSCVQPHLFQFKRPTIDQVIVQDPRFYGTFVPQFRSLEVGISRKRFHVPISPDYNTWEAVSQSGPGSPNFPELSVEGLHQKLFGVGVRPDISVLGERATLLDAVSEDAKSLRAELGVVDQQRLDKHLEHIYFMQQKFRQSYAACATPAVPAREGGFDSLAPEPLEEKTIAMAQLLAIAMQCDMTRVFSVMLSSPGSQLDYPWLGVGAHHGTAHLYDLNGLKLITAYNMRCFRMMLEVFANTPDLPDGTGGSLLDSMLVYGTSEMGDARHFAGDNDRDQLPVILAGNARGRMNTGIHYNEVGGNVARVHLTILNAMGLDTPQYGFSGSETNAVLPGLLV